MRGTFTFDGMTSSAFGVYISGNQTFNAAERDQEGIEVPGSDALLTLDNGRFLPVEHPYRAFIIQQFSENIRAFRNAIMAVRGSARLTDSYHPDEFYLARYGKGLEADVLQTLRAGEFEISFTRDPRRFLVAGETQTTLTANGTIENPTLFPSKPLIRVYGTGNVGIGSDTVTINYAEEYTDIDCDIQEAYKGTASCNEYVEVSGDNFPTLSPGENGITLGSGITRVIITPRWYIL